MQMTCDEARPLLGLFLDGELDTDQGADIEEHVTGCANCQDALAQQGQLRDVLRRAAATVDTPADLRQRIGVSIQRERRGPRGLARAWPMAVAVAILLSFVWRDADVAETAPAPQKARDGRSTGQGTATALPAVDIAAVQRGLQAHLGPAVRLPATRALSSPYLLGIAARTGDIDGTPAAIVQYALPHGSVFLTLRPAFAPAARRQTGEPGADITGLMGDKLVARRLTLPAPFVATAGCSAHWQTQGLKYVLDCDLPPDEIAGLLSELPRTGPP
jgi:anti-sigma factor (TIGR02949 family)